MLGLGGATKLDQPHAISELADQIRANLQRKPRLPHAPCPGKRD
jgi:hypothetical protein